MIQKLLEERKKMETLFCFCFGAEDISAYSWLKVQYEPDKTYCLKW